MPEIIIMKELLGENKKIAEENRKIYKSDNVTLINVMGAPGAGKTTFIKALAEELKAKGIDSGVIEGDLYSSIDADTFNEQGFGTVESNTCG